MLPCEDLIPLGMAKKLKFRKLTLSQKLVQDKAFPLSGPTTHGNNTDWALDLHVTIAQRLNHAIAVSRVSKDNSQY